MDMVQDSSAHRSREHLKGKRRLPSHHKTQPVGEHGPVAARAALERRRLGGVHHLDASQTVFEQMDQ